MQIYLLTNQAPPPSELGYPAYGWSNLDKKKALRRGLKDFGFYHSPLCLSISTACSEQLLQKTPYLAKPKAFPNK